MGNQMLSPALSDVSASSAPTLHIAILSDLRLSSTMSQKILCDVTLGPGATQYYGTLIVSNIRYENGTVVFIQKFLGLTLQSPAQINAGSINVMPIPWVQTSVEISNTQINADQYDVQIQVYFPQSFAINTGTSITIGVDGDLTSDRDSWTGSLALFADELPDNSGLFSPRWSLDPPSVFARLASQPATLMNFIGGMIREGFGCCFGHEDPLNEKLPGEITLKC